MDVTPIEPDSGVPLYMQVATDLRHRIDAGLSGRLPRELDLAADYEVGRQTIRSALALLRDWGYIETWPGKASRVRTPEERSPGT